MRDLPRGTVTLLFTDIEGSTRLLQSLGRERYVASLEAHRTRLRDAAARHHGVEVETQGDSFFFAFPYARDAVLAAAEGQLALLRHDWDGPPIKVRMGLHTGEPSISESGYAGLDVHRAARVMAVGHGGQILLSARTTDLVTQELPDSIGTRKLGVFQLKDFDGGETLTQLVVEGLPAAFAPIRAEKQPARIARLVPRPVRKHPWFAVGGLVVAAAAAIGATLLFKSPAPTLEPDSLAELNARTGKVISSVPVGIPLGRHRSGRIAVGCKFGRGDRLACRPLEVTSGSNALRAGHSGRRRGGRRLDLGCQQRSGSDAFDHHPH